MNRILSLALAVVPVPHRVAVAPAETLWVEVGRGTGETVVLVPGLAGSSFSFRNILPGLEAAGYRTIVIDPLGIGRSSRPPRADYSLTAQADRLAAVLDTLAERRVLLVAHSVAASMALRLAYRRPELVRGVVSIDGGAAESATTRSFRSALRLAPLLRLFGGRGRVRAELAAQLVEASGNPGWVTDSVIDGYARPVTADLGRSIGAYQAMARAREPEALAARLPRIHAPVLLLHGTAAGKSAGLQVTELEQLMRLMPALRVEAVEGAGHYIHEERPDVVVEKVVRFARAIATSYATAR